MAINEEEKKQLEVILSKLTKSWKIAHNNGQMRSHSKCTHKKYMKEHENGEMKEF